MADKLAFLFPGQGSQEVGMALDLYQNNPAARQIFEEADQSLGYPISNLSFQGPAGTLNLTINTQPAIFTASMACLQALKASGVQLKPRFVAGHSLGEYTALVAAGALQFAEGLQLVRERGRLMQEAGEKAQGGMAAILGLEDQVVEEIVREVDGGEQRLAVANYNCPGQVVVSGEKEALEEAMQLAKERGANRVVALTVSIPAHSPLMASAAQGMATALRQNRAGEAKIPLIANVTAQPISSPEDIHQELIAQLLLGVQWTKSIQRMVEEGVTAFLEIGPGRVLAGLVKRIHPGAKVYNVSNPKTLEETLARLSS
ncbi:MAG: ACP S-malonyltransferase [Chloroflexi bacterium]|nr:ACP S-malonyltransferase [Chloroflexota bacterium]